MDSSAKTPFPNGAPADPQTTGQIIQFTVTANPGMAAAVFPAALNPTLAGAFPNLPVAINTRILTLDEIMAAGGPTMVLLNGQKWGAPVSEMPLKG